MYAPRAILCIYIVFGCMCVSEVARKSPLLCDMMRTGAATLVPSATKAIGDFIMMLCVGENGNELEYIKHKYKE